MILMSSEGEYSPFSRSRASKLKRRGPPRFFRSGETVYYDGSKAWLLKVEWVSGKRVKKEWIRAQKYDGKRSG
jgi:hypothetical protein